MIPASLAALLAALALAAPVAHAHDDATLDRQAAPNGGQLRMAGPYHLELVLAKTGSDAEARPVVVHVTDHAGAAVSTRGALGSATILAGGRKASVPLAPEGDSRMRGEARYTVGPDTKVVVTITLAGGQPAQARFTPGAVVR